jgi:hypothetical protein
VAHHQVAIDEVLPTGPSRHVESNTAGLRDDPRGGPCGRIVAHVVLPFVKGTLAI